ncbi:hypothetical protein CANARDRAFT_29895 [[Candida] arabinofermentans NRRL YB-2248]|uniref:Uncharacterized protein n=1 Tax=[Candida] arabinofermentans NRRL YB-2248 TaxID=983967 RepID=A0A1E4SV96_9ASCO|nr:hypothetical protein CANARDRAFT_29895 [[Candida] arabinofermentans NRRL YB-2248]
MFRFGYLVHLKQRYNIHDHYEGYKLTIISYCGQQQPLVAVRNQNRSPANHCPSLYKQREIPPRGPGIQHGDHARCSAPRSAPIKLN